MQLLRELGRRVGVSEDYLAEGREDRIAKHQADRLLEAEVALRLSELELSERIYREVLSDAGSNENAAHALGGLGHLAFRRGDPRQAIELLERSLDVAGAAEFEQADVAETLGRAYAMVGELESAIAVFERCAEAAERDQDDVETMRFALLLGDALIDSGNLRRAEEMLARALALGRDSKNPRVRIDLYWSQSRLHAERNDSATAARYARRALEVLRMTEDTYRTARAHQLLAHIELDRGNADEALDLLHEGWPLLETSGNDVEQAHFRIEEARALARLGRREEAAALAMELTGKLRDALPEDAARAYTLLAEIFADLGDAARAQELYELAAELLEQRNPNRYLVDVYTKLADLLERGDRKDEAYEYLKKAVGMQNALAETHS